MKRNVLALGLVATILISPFALVACTGNVSQKTESKKETVIIDETETEVETEVAETYEEEVFNEKRNLVIRKLDEEKYEVRNSAKDEAILVLCKEEGTKYVAVENGLNLRNYPDKTDKSYVKAIPYAAEVQMIADSEDGWSIVEYDNVKYFCWGDMLVDEEPEPLKKTPTIVYVDGQYEELSTPIIVSEVEVETEDTIVEEDFNCSCAYYTPDQLRTMGVINWNGWKWTWYSQRILPGGGLVIPGRHVDENGYVCDENDYICLAASSLSKGTVVDTPFGKMGKVYDTGCAYGVLDVYTDF